MTHRVFLEDDGRETGLVAIWFAPLSPLSAVTDARLETIAAIRRKLLPVPPKMGKTAAIDVMRRAACDRLQRLAA
jgi:hypothetical protein